VCEGGGAARAHSGSAAALRYGHRRQRPVQEDLSIHRGIHIAGLRRGPPYPKAGWRSRRRAKRDIVYVHTQYTTAMKR
jgi:hypothetical protein